MNFHKAAHAFLACYWVREEEPPGGTFPATRRRMTSYPIPGLLDEASGGIGWTARRRESSWLVFGISRF